MNEFIHKKHKSFFALQNSNKINTFKKFQKILNLNYKKYETKYRIFPIQYKLIMFQVKNEIRSKKTQKKKQREIQFQLDNAKHFLNRINILLKQNKKLGKENKILTNCLSQQDKKYLQTILLFNLSRQTITFYHTKTIPNKIHYNINSKIKKNLEWTFPVSKRSLNGLILPELGKNPIDTKRFNFYGKILNSSLDVDISTGLHHHGEDSLRAGYRIQEVFHLSKTIMAAQNVFGLNLLAEIAKQSKSGNLGSNSSFSFDLFHELCIENLLIRGIMDLNQTISICTLKLIEGLISVPLQDKEFKILSELTRFGEEILQTKPIYFSLKKRKISSFTEKLIPILLNVKLLQKIFLIIKSVPMAQIVGLNVLIQISQHSIKSSYILTLKIPIIDTILYIIKKKRNISCCFQFLRFLLSTSKHISINFLHQSFFKEIKRFLYELNIKAKVECLKLFSIFFYFEIDTSLYSEIFGQIIQNVNNYSKKNKLFILKRAVYNLQSKSFLLISNSNNNKLHWYHVIKEIKIILCSLIFFFQNEKKRQWMISEFLNIGGLFHFLCDYFLILNNQILKKKCLFIYIQRINLFLIRKWFISDNILLKRILILKLNDLNQRYFDPMFKKLPNANLLNSLNPSSNRLVQMDSCCGFLRFCLSIISYDNINVTYLTTCKFVPKLITLFPIFHLTTERIFFMMLILKSFRWRMEHQLSTYILKFYIFFPWKNFISNLQIYSNILSLVETLPPGQNDIYFILIQSSLKNRQILELLRKIAISRIKKNLKKNFVLGDLYFWKKYSTESLRKNIISLYKTLVSFEKKNTKDNQDLSILESLFLSKRKYLSMWMLRPLLNKELSNDLNLIITLRFFTLLYLTNNSHLKTYSVWAIFYIFTNAFLYNINMFLKEEWISELKTVVLMIWKDCLFNQPMLIVNLKQHYTHLIYNYNKDFFNQPLYSSIILIPLINLELQIIFWEKIRFIQYLQPIFVEGNLNNYLYALVERRMLIIIIEAINMNYITPTKTPFPYILGLAYISKYFFKNIDTQLQFQIEMCFSDEYLQDLRSIDIINLELENRLTLIIGRIKYFKSKTNI